MAAGERTPGASPGALRSLGERDSDQDAAIRWTRISDDGTESETIESFDQMPEAPDEGWIWIDLVGPTAVATLAELEQRFGIHRLVLEDVAHTVQRPKVEDHESYHLVIVRQRRQAAERAHQVSLIVSDRWLITVRELEDDLLSPVRRRLAQRRSLARRQGPIGLVYAILDTIVDHELVAVASLRADVEALEEAALDEPLNQDQRRELHLLRRDALRWRRLTTPMELVLDRLMRPDGPIADEETRLHLRDVADHVLRARDTLDAASAVLAQLHDLQVAESNQRMSEAINMLTLLMSVFVPITFLAGIYGMNFENMPELGWRWGYPTLMVVMAVVATGMLLMFRRRGWL